MKQVAELQSNAETSEVCCCRCFNLIIRHDVAYKGQFHLKTNKSFIHCSQRMNYDFCCNSDSQFYLTLTVGQIAMNFGPVVSDPHLGLNMINLLHPQVQILISLTVMNKNTKNLICFCANWRVVNTP